MMKQQPAKGAARQPVLVPSESLRGATANARIRPAAKALSVPLEAYGMATVRGVIAAALITWPWA